jgi:hypothetical protein
MGVSIDSLFVDCYYSPNSQEKNMKYLILLPALVFVLFTALSAEDWYGINLPEELH